MELFTIPFQEKFIVYRPLRRLAFIANSAMVGYIQNRLDHVKIKNQAEIEQFLRSISFWQPDPPPPPVWRPRTPHRPSMAVLLLTTDCNLCCTYCYARGGEGHRFQMNASQAQIAIDTVVENARQRGLDHFELAFHGGGEPTLHHALLRDAIKYARSKSLPCRISIASNGLWDKRIADLICAQMDEISLSFDGMASIQNKQRPLADGRGSLGHVMKSLRLLNRKNKSYGLRLTITPPFFDLMADNIDWICRHCDAAAIQVEPCYADERGCYQDPSPEQAEMFCRGFLSAFQVANTHNRRLFYSGARPWVLAGSFCRAPEDALVLTPEGDVVTCFEMHDRRHPLLKHFKIGEVKRDRIEFSAKEIRSFVDGQKERRASCRGCFCFWHCGGDCTSRCLAAKTVPRGRCEVNRTITRELLAWNIAQSTGVWTA